jgi:hypothetical protein
MKKISKKFGLYLITILLILTILIIATYPSFLILKPYAISGGFIGSPITKQCDCTLVKYQYYPEGCSDCFTEYYCIGLLKNCKCYNSTTKNYKEC